MRKECPSVQSHSLSTNSQDSLETPDGNYIVKHKIGMETCTFDDKRNINSRGGSNSMGLGAKADRTAECIWDGNA